jgi:hypothetical protein
VVPAKKVTASDVRDDSLRLTTPAPPTLALIGIVRDGWLVSARVMLAVAFDDGPVMRYTADAEHPMSTIRLEDNRKRYLSSPRKLTNI